MYLAHNPQNLRITKNVNKSSCSSSNKLVCFRQGDRGRNEETNGTFRISHGCFHFLPVTLSSLLAPQSQVIKAPILDSPRTTNQKLMKQTCSVVNHNEWSTTMTFHSNQSTPFVYQSSSSSPNRPPPLISMSSSSSSSSSLTSSAGAAASAAAGAAATAKAEGSARKALKGSAFSKE